MDFIIAVFAFKLDLQTDFAITVAIRIVIATTSTTAITRQ